MALVEIEEVEVLDGRDVYGIGIRTIPPPRRKKKWRRRNGKADCPGGWFMCSMPGLWAKNWGFGGNGKGGILKHGNKHSRAYGSYQGNIPAISIHGPFCRFNFETDKCPALLESEGCFGDSLLSGDGVDLHRTLCVCWSWLEISIIKPYG